MPTPTEYVFSIQNDFPNHKVASDRLTLEIQASSIVTALERIDTDGDACDIWFKAALSAGDETTLDGIVATHSGEPLPAPSLVTMADAAGTALPTAADGKLFVLPNMFPGPVILTFAGASDDVQNKKPIEGDLFGLQIAASGADATFTVDLIDGVFVSGGHVEWVGGSYGSSIELELWTPASTTKAPAVAHQGNCNRVATGAGFDIIVPAAGNGEYDLDVGVPVTAENAESAEPNGYWDYSDPWVGIGTVYPNVQGKGKYNLYTAELELAHFCRLHLLRDIGSRDVTVQNIKPKWILPQWKLKAVLHNASASKELSVAWDLELARRRTA